MADPTTMPLITDSIALLIAMLLGIPWMLLPGAGLTRLIERTGIDCGTGWERAGWSLLLAATVLPAVDALVVRWSGMAGMACIHSLLALLALTQAARLWPARGSGWNIAVPLIGLWALIVAFDFVDFNIGGALNQSLLDLDMVKHAAVTGAIAREGLPFSDPFFARPGFVGYYYYFYLWPAAMLWSGGALVNARMAFAAADFWVGLTFTALLWRIAVDARLIRPGRAHAFMGLLLIFCFVSGADLLMIAIRAITTGKIEAQTDCWNTEIVFALRSILWVPHHMTAMVAAWGAFLLIVRAQNAIGKARWILAAMAGLGIATCFGSSVWIMLTVAPVLVGWGCLALWRRDPMVPVAGAVALMAALTQISDLMTYRHDSGLPIALSVRPFTTLLPEGGDWTWVHLAALPLNYAMEFGLFLWGTIGWWRSRAFDRHQPVQWLLLASSIASLLVASFLKSTIINNDLAWRSIWFAQLAAILWTAAWLQGPERRLGSQPITFHLLLALGIGAVAWDVIGMRLIRPPLFHSSFDELISPRPDDDDQRRIYKKAAQLLPVQDVIQHNPALHKRIFNFGLYGIQRTGVADGEANLFGASPQDVQQRITALQPIFERPLPPSEIRRRAEGLGVDHLIFALMDPIWIRYKGPPPRLTCRIREPLACLVSVKDIGS